MAVNFLRYPGSEPAARVIQQTKKARSLTAPGFRNSFRHYMPGIFLQPGRMYARTSPLRALRRLSLHCIVSVLVCIRSVIKYLKRSFIDKKNPAYAGLYIKLFLLLTILMTCPANDISLRTDTFCYYVLIRSEHVIIFFYEAKVKTFFGNKQIFLKYIFTCMRLG